MCVCVLYTPRNAQTSTPLEKSFLLQSLLPARREREPLSSPLLDSVRSEDALRNGPLEVFFSLPRSANAAFYGMIFSLPEALRFVAGRERPAPFTSFLGPTLKTWGNANTQRSGEGEKGALSLS